MCLFYVNKIALPTIKQLVANSGLVDSVSVGSTKVQQQNNPNNTSDIFLSKSWYKV